MITVDEHGQLWWVITAFVIEEPTETGFQIEVESGYLRISEVNE